MIEIDGRHKKCDAGHIFHMSENQSHVRCVSKVEPIEVKESEVNATTKKKAK